MKSKLVFTEILVLIGLIFINISPLAETEVQEDLNPIIQQELVLIPAGEFQMGVDSTRFFSPAHKVLIDSFYIDKYEVTNSQYHKSIQLIQLYKLIFLLLK